MSQNCTVAPRISAKFSPRLLTDDQKENRVNISQKLLDCANVDENVLKNIVKKELIQLSEMLGSKSIAPKHTRTNRRNYPLEKLRINESVFG